MVMGGWKGRRRGRGFGWNTGNGSLSAFSDCLLPALLRTRAAVWVLPSVGASYPFTAAAFGPKGRPTTPAYESFSICRSKLRTPSLTHLRRNRRTGQPRLNCDVQVGFRLQGYPPFLNKPSPIIGSDKLGERACHTLQTGRHLNLKSSCRESTRDGLAPRTQAPVWHCSSACSIMVRCGPRATSR